MTSSAKTRHMTSTHFWLFILCSLSIVSTTSILAQPTPLEFTHFSTQEGTSNSNVGDICTDRHGFLWVGTDDGLNRFDGQKFKTYFHQPENPHSLSYNTISAIFEDKQGRLWIGTRGGGLNLYDETSDQFFRFRSHPEDSLSLCNDYVNCVFQSADQRIWIGTDLGLSELLSLNEATGEARFHSYVYNQGQQGICGKGVQSIAEYPIGQLWLGMSVRGLCRMDVQRTMFTSFPHQKDNPNSLSSNLVKTVLLDTTGTRPMLWVATAKGFNQVLLDSIHTPSVQRIYRNPEQPHHLPHNNLTHAASDAAGNIWISTYGGGFAQLTSKHPPFTFDTYTVDPSHPNSLRGNEVYSIYPDPEGILWVGLQYHGLARAYVGETEANRRNFSHIQRAPFRTGIIPTQSITALFEDQQGYHWVGTEAGGLDRVHPQTGEFQRYFSGPNGLSHNLITTINQDEQGDMWIGTFGGFNHAAVNPDGTLQVDQYVPDPEDSTSLSDKHIFAVWIDAYTDIWIGTRGGGLNRFNRATKKFKTYRREAHNPHSINNNYIWDILPEGKQGLWLATDGGVNYFDKESEQFQHFSHNPTDEYSLSHDYVNSIFRDSQGRMWVCTSGGGMNLFINDSSQKFQRIRERDGLLDDKVYGILEDHQGRLWISSPSGLSRFEPNKMGPSASFTSSMFQHFDQNDGLQGNEFNMGAWQKLRDGRLMFGGLNGYNIFHPDSIRQNEHIPQVIITDIRVLNESLVPGKPIKNGNIPLTTSPHIATEIQLTHKDYVVEFEFAALNFLYPENNQYAYQLEGFDEDWVYTGNRSRATYTNLDGGTYTFRVKASNNDGVWNETGTHIRVEVSPPPWKTVWAYGLYFLSGMGLVLGFVRYRIREREKELETANMIERAKLEEREIVRKRTSADFHDELGNKMTKISLFVEMAKRSAPKQKELHTYLDQIGTNTQVLSEGMRDFIWVLDPDKDSLFDSLLRLKDFGDQLYEHTDITFRIQGLSQDLQACKLPLEIRRHVVLLFKEAMNNSLKYAEADRVDMTIHQHQEQYEICFTDNGKGFNPQITADGYGLQNMQSRAEKMRGKLDILSELGKGTTVCLTLDLPQMGD